jgi:hypothetical protein
MIKSRKSRRAGDIVGMGEKTYVHRILENHFVDLGIVGSIILKWTLKI